MASCLICIVTKFYTRSSRGKHYYIYPQTIMEVISMDLFGPLPKSYENNVYVLVLMDQFSKNVNLYPIRSQDLITIEKILLDKYFRDTGIPDTILTDCEGQFITRRWKEFAKYHGFNIRKTSPYNPQLNPVERVMREIGRTLRVYNQ